MMLGYSLLLTLALLVSAPWWVVRMVTTDRYREGLSQRLGRVPAALREAVRGRRVVWLHAVSVGEVLAATRLIAEMEEALGREWLVVLSTTTRTAQTLARERFGAERVFYMPLDFAFCIRAYLRALRPAALILMESELWPRLLHECLRSEVPVAVANARISDRSFARAMKVRAVWSHVLRMPTMWLAQSEQDAGRLAALGVRAETIRNTGNMKYDVRASRHSEIAERIKTIAARRPIIVAGSTVVSTAAKVDAEEAQVIEAWMKGALPSNAMLVVAPRHPERFEEVWTMVSDFPAVKADALAVNPAAKDVAEADIVLLNTIGDLAAVYGIADIAYVGGSMVSRGGHNPLEPAQFGVPVVMGASYENFREIVARMIASDGIRIVRDEVELQSVFEMLLSQPDEARALGERGRSVFESQAGATARTVAAVLAMIEERL